MKQSGGLGSLLLKCSKGLDRQLGSVNSALSFKGVVLDLERVQKRLLRMLPACWQKGEAGQTDNFQCS